jgi:hypothetical protein
MTPQEESNEIYNELLRGEISAIEAYSMVIHKFSDFAADDALTRIRNAHQQSAAALRKLIKHSGSDPATNSGIWGGFVKALEGTAGLFGESPALMILQKGELHGISQYNEALSNAHVSDEAKELIRTIMLPPLDSHLIELQARRDRVSDVA